MGGSSCEGALVVAEEAAPAHLSAAAEAAELATTWDAAPEAAGAVPHGRCLASLGAALA